MSLSLAKKCMREFDQVEGTSRKIKKRKQSKPVKKVSSSTDQEETIKKLLMLNTSLLDGKTARKLMKKATNSKRKVIKCGQDSKTEKDDSDDEKPAADEAIFTEEDFKKFADEYQPTQN